MSRMHNQYRELESSYNYIDKTECLEKEIERFPSVYIEGAAGCGKTTMMRMLLEKHPEVDYTVLWMDEDEEYERYVDKYVDKSSKYVDNSRWLADLRECAGRVATAHSRNDQKEYPKIRRTRPDHPDWEERDSGCAAWHILEPLDGIGHAEQHAV